MFPLSLPLYSPPLNYYNYLISNTQNYPLPKLGYEVHPIPLLQEAFLSSGAHWKIGNGAEGACWGSSPCTGTPWSKASMCMSPDIITRKRPPLCLLKSSLSINSASFVFSPLTLRSSSCPCLDHSLFDFQDQECTKNTPAIFWVSLADCSSESSQFNCSSP